MQIVQPRRPLPPSRSLTRVLAPGVLAAALGACVDEPRADVRDAACPSLEVEHLGRFAFDTLGQRGEIVLDRQHLYGGRLRDGNIDGVAIDVDSGHEVVVMTRGEILDAHDGVAFALRYRGTLEVMAASAEGDELWAEPVPSSYRVDSSRTPAPRRLFSRAGDAPGPYWAENGGEPARWRLMSATSSGKVTYIDGGFGTVLEPYVHGDDVLYVVRDETNTQRLFLGPDGPPSPLTTVAAGGRLGGWALSDDAAWWIEGGALRRYDLDRGQVQALDAGPCRALAAAGTNVAAACGDLVTVYRGEERSDFEVGAGRRVRSLDVNETLVAWIELPDDCGGSDDGQVRVADPATGERVEVARVGAPCSCCNDIAWAQPSLRLADDVLAWTFPVDEVGPERAPQRVERVVDAARVITCGTGDARRDAAGESE